MEYKNMREVYKGNIYQIWHSNYEGFDRFDVYRFNLMKLKLLI